MRHKYRRHLQYPHHHRCPPLRSSKQGRPPLSPSICPPPPLRLPSSPKLLPPHKPQQGLPLHARMQPQQPKHPQRPTQHPLQRHMVQLLQWQPGHMQLPSLLQLPLWVLYPSHTPLLTTATTNRPPCLLPLGSLLLLEATTSSPPPCLPPLEGLPLPEHGQPSPRASPLPPQPSLHTHKYSHLPPPLACTSSLNTHRYSHRPHPLVCTSSLSCRYLSARGMPAHTAAAAMAAAPRHHNPSECTSSHSTSPVHSLTTSFARTRGSCPNLHQCQIYSSSSSSTCSSRHSSRMGRGGACLRARTLQTHQLRGKGRQWHCQQLRMCWVCRRQGT
mmetsp:Transcript_3197/g.8471  ORF Transcript_3197/g.8471 Transcript_3197/m.8471 type:complete len:330 (+) Transcript_3197:1870-2859(+)